MARIVLLTAIVTILINANGEDSLARNLAGEVDVTTNHFWQLTTDSIDFPIQFVRQNPPAELLVFKAIISEDDLIRSPEELKLSVDLVVSDVIMKLPEAQLLSSSGFSDSLRAGFMLDFVTTDTIEAIRLRHRFVTYLYRHPDGQQFLFTLWGKSAADSYETISAELISMQESFIYTGPSNTEVFAERESYRLTYVTIPFLVILVYWMMRRRRTYKEESFVSHERNDSLKRPSL